MYVGHRAKGPGCLEPFSLMLGEGKEGGGTNQIIGMSFALLHAQTDKWPWSFWNRYTIICKEEGAMVEESRAMRVPTKAPVK